MPAPYTLPALSHLVGPTIAGQWLDALNAAAVRAQAVSPRRRQHFLAQCLTETLGLTRLSECLDYGTPERLCAVFPRYFPSLASAAPYLHAPEKLANHVYAGRTGNGDEASGDGWRYRGQGPIHLTFRGNYAAIGARIGHPEIEQHPELVQQPGIGALTYAQFWTDRGCNAYADKDDRRGVRGRINGPALAGLADANTWLDKIRAAGI